MKVNLEQILSLTGTKLAFESDVSSVFIESIKPLDEAKETDLAFFAPTSKRLIPELTEALKCSKAAAVVLREPITEFTKPQIVSEEPLMTIMQVAARWFAIKQPESGISDKAEIHPSAVIGKNVSIAPFCVVSENTKVGDNCVLHPNVVLYSGVSLGSNCIVHSGAIIRENVILGDDCQVQNCAVIGADGFGYKRGKNGEQHRIPHIGTVVAENSVDFGAGTCIDRGMLGNTEIGRQTKFDNMVQLGHNVKVGESSLFCSQSGVSGSTKIGKDCIFGGQSGVADHINIPDGTMLAAQGGVIQSPKKAEKLAGTPSMGITHWKRLHTINMELPKLIRQLKKMALLNKILIACLLLSACSSKDKGPEEMLKAIEVPEYELYSSATEAYDKGFYSLSREKFQTLIFGYPASPVAELATLKIAETYFYNQLYNESIASYQSFIGKFPGSKYASYAKFQIGDAELAQFKGVLRDQYPLIQAANSYKTLLGRNHFLVPESKVIGRLELISNLLLKHEEKIVNFYEKQGLVGAAAKRRADLKLAKNYNSPIEVIELLTPRVR